MNDSVLPASPVAQPVVFNATVLYEQLNAFPLNEPDLATYSYSDCRRLLADLDRVREPVLARLNKLDSDTIEQISSAMPEGRCGGTAAGETCIGCDIVSYVCKLDRHDRDDVYATALFSYRASTTERIVNHYDARKAVGELLQFTYPDLDPGIQQTVEREIDIVCADALNKLAS